MFDEPITRGVARRVELLDAHDVVVPERVVDELADTAAYDDPSGRGADAVLDRLASFDVRGTELDETFPL